MVGSPKMTMEEQSTSEGHIEHDRGRSSGRGRSVDRERLLSQAGRGEVEARQEPKSGNAALPPYFSPPTVHSSFTSAHHQRLSRRSASRHRHDRPGREAEAPTLEPTTRRRSADRRSHHSRRHRESPTSHKRRRTRSRSASTHRHKHHRRERSRSLEASPAAEERRIHSRRDRVGASAGSPRPAPEDGTVATRREADIDRRYRSRSRDARHGGPPGEGRRPASPGAYRRRPEDRPAHHRRGYSREADYRLDYLPPRGYPSDREADFDGYSRSGRDDYYAYPPHQRRTPPPPSGELRAHHHCRHSRSPPAPPSRRESFGSLRQERAPAQQSELNSSAKRSVSRESRQSHRPDRERDDEMYGRGGQYGGYRGHPPNHGHQGYPPSGHPSHAPSPMQGYPQQQSPYGSQAGPHSQPGVPYYQPKPSRQFSNPPSHSGNQTPQRGGPSQRGGRGHFANLSWTPGDGVRGGNLVQPGDKSQEGSVSAATGQEADAEDDDNPFRPPADLRAEDESAQKKRKTPTGPAAAQTIPAGPKTAAEKEAEAEKERNKISFSIKGRANAQIAAAAAEKTQSAPKPDASPLASKKTPAPVSPLIQSSVPKSRNYEGNTRLDPTPRKPSPPPTRKETVRKKRIKAQPTLSEDFAQSDSVYYRKTGNESVIGSGTYGKVYKAIHVYTGRMVALKKIRMEGERDGFPVTATREIKLLQSLNHTNVVPLQEVMVERNDCFMVFEYQAHDLTGLLNHPTFTLTEGHKKHLAKQMFEGLAYLHQRGVLHRDIKAANILISKTGELKYADFGLARFYQKRQEQDYTNRVITIWYRPPELLLGETQYAGEVDIWSAACVLVEIFTRHAIFPGDGGEINQLDKIYNVLGTPSRSEWPGIAELQWYELLRPTHRIASTFRQKYEQRVPPKSFELLELMFHYDPNIRPTAADVLEHEYFHTDPPAQRVWELEGLEGDWHEFESKALRKEKEKLDREARRREREREGVEGKRKAEEATAGGPSEKKVKVSGSGPEALV